MTPNLEGYLVPFGLVLARVSAFAATCPLFVPDNVSGAIRAALCAVLSISLFTALPHYSVPENLVLAVLIEVLLGAVFAASVRLVAVAIGFAGELFDINLGYGFARIMNPMLGEEVTPMMHLAQMLGSLTFLLADGQRHVIEGLSMSFRVFPPGAAGFDIDWVSLLIRHLSAIVQAGLLMALPIVLAMMCTQLALALLSRIAPALNIWAIGLLGTCGMGLLALWCFMPAWIEAMGQMWRSPQPWLFGDMQ